MSARAFAVLLLVGVAVLSSRLSWAADDSDSVGGASQTSLGDLGKDTKNPPAPDIGQKEPTESASTENNRMKTLEGSRSRWSGQFNLTYSGGALSSPFSAEAPNPGGQVPPPLVTMAGTVAARYRLNDATTMGLGTGITTQTPFQGPKNTSVADPYVDIARSFGWGPIHNRADLQATLWTNSQYHDTYGYRGGFTALDEGYYAFKFGLTVGLVLQLDYNLFANGSYDASQQTEWDLYTDPYFEYALSKTFNLRSVVGIASLHNNDQGTPLALYHPDIYQTLGVGISVSSAVFLYPFVQYFPFSGNVSTDTALAGFNTIINLF